MVSRNGKPLVRITRLDGAKRNVKFGAFAAALFTAAANCG